MADFDETIPVDDLMRRWPGTIEVFLHHRLGCVGCPIRCFHTVEDACREHGVNTALFMSDLVKASRGEAGVERRSVPALG
jgi:hybrid cluster-associated redox disulfide protein